MRKALFFTLILGSLSLSLSSCAFFRKPLDKMYGFSQHLSVVEAQIEQENWHEATASLKKAIKSWFKTKPFLQIDVDHDYINEIEADFIRLKSAIDTKEKTQSLTSVRLIKDNWNHIGSM